MGAFIVFRISFKKGTYMKQFMNKYKPKILVIDTSESYGFGAWKFNWKPYTLIVDMGFMGYEEPNQIKKKLKEKIKEFSWIAINNKDSRWSTDTQRRDE